MATDLIEMAARAMTDLEPIPTWAHRLVLVDEALAENGLSRAVYQWREAYGAALRSRQWEPLAAVGRAAVGIEAVAGPAAGFRAEAVRAYLAALLRARAQGSAAGAWLIAESLASLGRPGDGRTRSSRHGRPL